MAICARQYVHDNMCMAICARQYVQGKISTTPARHQSFKTAYNWKAFEN
jgi:hypothetical protein